MRSPWQNARCSRRQTLWLPKYRRVASKYLNVDSPSKKWALREALIAGERVRETELHVMARKPPHGMPTASVAAAMSPTLRSHRPDERNCRPPDNCCEPGATPRGGAGGEMAGARVAGRNVLRTEQFMCRPRRLVSRASVLGTLNPTVFHRAPVGGGATVAPCPVESSPGPEVSNAHQASISRRLRRRRRGHLRRPPSHRVVVCWPQLDRPAAGRRGRSDEHAGVVFAVPR